MSKILLKFFSVFCLICLMAGTASANRSRVTGVAVGTQSSTPVYSSAGNVTYTITLTKTTVTGVQANDDLLLSWGTTPAGVTVTFTPNAGTYTAGTGAYSPGTTSSFT